MDVATDQIDQFIERRAEQNKESRAEEMAWKSSCRVYNRKLERARVAEWYAFHADQAERHRRTLEDLITHHEERARQLLQEGSA